MREHSTTHACYVDSEIQAWPPILVSVYGEVLTVMKATQLSSVLWRSLERDDRYPKRRRTGGEPIFRHRTHLYSEHAHSAPSPYLVVTKISIRMPCLNFAVYSSCMLPRRLRRLDALLVKANFSIFFAPVPAPA